MKLFIFCLKIEYERFPLFVKSNLRVRFILRGSLQQLTSGFYEGLKLKWEMLTPP
jgi:hypothetical protein